MSYILPIPVYAAGLFLIIGFNAELMNKYGVSEPIAYLAIIIEMTILISFFNHIAYESSLKHISMEKAKKIFKSLVVVNAFLIIAIMIFMHVKTS
ncbi:MAG: hypothetical protein ACRDD2_14380 [Sarcina sp.]